MGNIATEFEPFEKKFEPFFWFPGDIIFLMFFSKRNPETQNLSFRGSESEYQETQCDGDYRLHRHYGGGDEYIIMGFGNEEG